MRHGCALALTILMPLISSALLAQDPSEEWAADSMATDSSDYTGEVDDTTLRRPRERMDSGPNPYLREIGKSDRAVPQWWGSIAAGAGTRSFRYARAGQAYGPGSTGPTLSVEIGRRFSERAGLGLEYIGWAGDFQDDFVAALQSLLVIARFYPLGSVGPFLKLGGGLGTYGIYDLQYDDMASLDAGPAYVLGAGWDIPAGGKLVISPIVEWQHLALFGDRNYHGRLLSFGLMITWSGREDEIGPFSLEE